MDYRKNKGIAICNSNSIRVDKANEERIRKANAAKKDLSKLDNELEKLDKKRAKLFGTYKDGIITKEEFKVRKDELITYDNF